MLDDVRDMEEKVVKVVDVQVLCKQTFRSRWAHYAQGPDAPSARHPLTLATYACLCLMACLDSDLCPRPVPEVADTAYCLAAGLEGPEPSPDPECRARLQALVGGDVPHSLLTVLPPAVGSALKTLGQR